MTAGWQPIYEPIPTPRGDLVVREHPQRFDVVLIVPSGDSVAMDAATARAVADALLRCAAAVEDGERAAGPEESES